MDPSSFSVPAYPTATLIISGLMVAMLFIAGLVSFLYWMNTRIRRGMKKTHDDWRIEKDIEAGHTLHAEGVYGRRHPEEGGKHLRQEDRHPRLSALKTDLKHEAKARSKKKRSH